MRAIIVYESMYGNTRQIAEAIGRVLGSAADVAVPPVAAAMEQPTAGWDLFVVGDPTHAHGLSPKTTRKSAVDAAGPGSQLEAEPGAPGKAYANGWTQSTPPSRV